MAIVEGGRAALLCRCDQKLVAPAAVDDRTPLCPWAALIGLTRLLVTKNRKRPWSWEEDISSRPSQKRTEETIASAGTERDSGGKHLVLPFFFHTCKASIVFSPENSRTSFLTSLIRFRWSHPTLGDQCRLHRRRCPSFPLFFQGRWAAHAGALQVNHGGFAHLPASRCFLPRGLCR